MKVTILGYSGGLQAADSTNTSLLVRTGNTSILVDTSGSPCTAMLSNGQDPDTLDAVLITHAHIDHIYALPSLLHNLWLRKRVKPLLIAGNAYTIEKAKQLFTLFALETKKEMCPLEWRVLQPEEGPFSIGNTELFTFPLFHRPEVPVNGFVFCADGKKLSYFPDSVISKPYPACACNANLMIHEAGGLDSKREALANAGHSSARQAALAAAEMGAGRLVLVHLPCSEDMRRAIFKEARESSAVPLTEPSANLTLEV